MRVLLILLALVLFAVPVTAYAHTVTPFAASGSSCLSQLPTRVIGVPNPKGVLVHASGEELLGSITTVQGWDDLAGATIAATITQETSVFDFTTLTFSGTIAGSLTVTTADAVFTGDMKGTVSGTFSDPNDLIGSISGSEAQVSWHIKGPGMQASGEATATFADTNGSFCGPLSLTGSRGVP